MILYAAAAAALMIFLAVRTHLDAKPTADPKKRARFNLTAGLAGALLALLAFAVGMILIGRLDDGEWARDMFLGYFEIAAPAAAAVTLLLLLASLGAHGSPKLQSGLFPRLRVLANLAATCLLLLVTPLYAALADNKTVPHRPLILLAGIGISLLFRLALLAEYRVRRS